MSEKLNLSKYITRPTMVFRTIPEKSPNFEDWMKLDKCIQNGKLKEADTLLNILHGKLINGEERSLWFDRGARTLFLHGDYLGSIRAMQLSIKCALLNIKKS